MAVIDLGRKTNIVAEPWPVEHRQLGVRGAGRMSQRQVRLCLDLSLPRVQAALLRFPLLERCDRNSVGD
jgi:hypothetical protein